MRIVSSRLLRAAIACGLVLAAAALVTGAVPASAAPSAESSQTTTIVDGAPGTLRFDVNGDAIDAHDGQIQRFGDTYYLYGTSYGCGFTWQEHGAPFCGFRVYSSPDLSHWTDRGPLFDASTPTWQQRCNGSTSGCFRPHVVYNASTRRYVLWINSYDNTVDYHVFTSESPTGPFAEQSAPKLAINQSAPPTAVNNGDEDVFVDRDGTAYLVYTDWVGGGDLVVEQLTPDYLSGTGRFARLNTRSTEAPSMFRRGDRYYITYSDPNCGYCAGTGTSYLTAPSPLGPWTGASTTPDTWQVANGQLKVTGGEIGLSAAGADWTDYTMSFDTVPLQTGDGGTYAQAGWVFRAADTGTGYAWLLGNFPYPGAESGSLTKVIFKNGIAVSATVVPLPFPVVGDDSYHVATTVSGSTITTVINGVTVDTTVDSTFSSGRVGFRESGSDGESALFDNLQVTAPDGTVLLADTFSTPGDLTAWDRPAPVVKGTSISATSCGGQPDDVAVLPAPGGLVYLYQSDRWNNGAPNEALATGYWEPMRFGADGSILPLRCGSSYALTLAGLHQGADSPPPNLDQSSGPAGFTAFCDVQKSITRAQTFTVGRSGTLSRVAVTMFQANNIDSALTLSVAPLDASGHPGPTLWSTSVPASSVSWSPGEVAADPDVPVTAGQRYAVQISAPGATRGCYGFAYSDADPYVGGGELYSSSGGQAWMAETGRDLKFETSVVSDQ